MKTNKTAGDVPGPTVGELRALARRIEEAYEAGAPGQGREQLEKALVEARDLPAYHEFFRALAARHLAGDREEQERRLEAALALAPDDPFLLRNTGAFLAATGRDEEALDLFDRALDADPDDAASMRRKGVSLSRLGHTDEALIWFDNALDADPDDAASMRNLGVTLSRSGRNEEAIPWFDRALAADPRDHAAMRQKGVCLANLGHLDEALIWFDRALESHPADRAALVNKARTLLEAGNPALAAAAYDRLIASERNNPYHYLEKAIALAKLGRDAEAAEAVDHAYGLARPSERLRRGKPYWLKRLGLAPARARPGAEAAEAGAADAGDEYGDIARVMEKTWEVFREDIKSFRGKIAEAKNHFNLFINSSGMFDKSRIFLLGARKWNSYTPTLPLGDDDGSSVGGGYFLSANGVGTVIDPGFNFLENFSAMGGRLSDIHNVVVTHAHNDHTNDLESILTLFHQRNKSGRGEARSRVNLYMNLGAFQKFSPMINLRGSDHIGEVKVIAPGETYELAGSGVSMRVLPAHHDEIFSRTYAVGLLFTLPTKPAKTVLFTGDTGLFPAGTDIAPDNAAEMEIGRQYRVAPGEVDFFIPHLGSIGDNELKSPDRQERLGESFYPNHLGVQGLIRLITQLRPRHVFVSEFGEELKGFIELLMELIIRCVREVGELNGLASPPPTILPMDLFFFCDLAREEIFCAGTETFEPLANVMYLHLAKSNISQFHYLPRNVPSPAVDAYFAIKKLEYACRTNSGPFSDKANRTRRMTPVMKKRDDFIR